MGRLLGVEWVGVLTAAPAAADLGFLPLLEGVCWSLCVGPVGRNLGDDDDDEDEDEDGCGRDDE